MKQSANQSIFNSPFALNDCCCTFPNVNWEFLSVTGDWKITKSRQLCIDCDLAVIQNNPSLLHKMYDDKVHKINKIPM